MEKQGMAGRYGFRRVGLLIFFLITAGVPLVPQYSRNPEDFFVETYPPEPEPFSPWFVSLLVNYPDPGMVRVESPPFPESLVMERMRVESRLIRNKDRDERWTWVEYLFTPKSEGEVNLGPFKIYLPGKELEIPAITVSIGSRPAKQDYHPGLFWGTPPGGLRAGTKTDLSLFLRGWDPAKRLSFPLPFRVTIPGGLIVETSVPSLSERESGKVLSLSVIPLREGRAELPSVTLDYEGVSLSAPPLVFEALPRAEGPPAVSAAPRESPEATDGELAADVKKKGAAFPGEKGGGFLVWFFRDQYERAIDTARARWETGDYARALAELRRGERDLGAGPAIAELRRGAEERLDLGITEDEIWQPKKLIQGLSAAAFVILSAAFFLSLRKRRSGNEGAKRKSRSPLFYAGLALLFLLPLSGVLLELWPEGPGRGRAVLSACTAYRVPDYSGAASNEFKEGQPARIRWDTQNWIYVETYDGRSGWVSEAHVISY